MQSIAELLQKTHEFFQKKEIEESRFHAERLLAECLNVDRISVYLNFEKIADEQLITNYRNKIQEFLNEPNLAVSIKDQLNELKKTFKVAHVPEADLHAEELVAHVLGMSRNQLKLLDDRLLSDEEMQSVNRLQKRRLNREPLQYIMGYTEFYGYPIRLNKNVLIPRPETEILVEKTLELIDKKELLSVLDIGTGSGCIAIALKKERPNLQISALDFSENALLLAAKNASKNDAEINFLQMDFLNETFWDKLEQFDLIISNPPYVTQSDLQELEPELAFEPQNALSDFADGLTFYKAIERFAQHHLTSSGSIALEIGSEQGSAIKEIFRTWQAEVNKDYNGFDRVLIAKK